jgi:hypothetical protein
MVTRISTPAVGSNVRPDTVFETPVAVLGEGFGLIMAHTVPLWVNFVRLGDLDASTDRIRNGVKPPEQVAHFRIEISPRVSIDGCGEAGRAPHGSVRELGGG